MLSKLIFKSLYLFCSPNTKIILGNMDDKAELIQRCIDEDLKYQVESQAARTWDYEAQSTGNFSRWVKILEVGTFNPIERLVIKAALYSHKRMATKKIICSTLVDGGYTSEKEEEGYIDYPDTEDLSAIDSDTEDLEDLNAID